MKKHPILLVSIFLLLLTPSTYADEIQRKSIPVLNSHISYLEGGEENENTVLFIHGVPTSSYLWRNIIPEVSENNHVIAIDLIGHGASGKPFIEYRLQDHLRYLTAFIKALELDQKQITLVLHDWGTAIGFIYASQHPENISGLAFMEAMFAPVPDPSFMPEIAIQMRGAQGWKMIVEDNFFLNNMLPAMTMVPFSEETLKQYKKPFRKKENRRALRMWPLEVPIAGLPADNNALFVNYFQYLSTTNTPKLLLYSTPGVLTKETEVNFAETYFPNIESIHIGEGLHFIQEEHPNEVSYELSNWLETL